MRDGWHYIQDYEDKVQVETYAAIQLQVYGSQTDNNTLGTTFLCVFYLHFQEKKAKNWVDKAEALQKGGRSSLPATLGSLLHLPYNQRLRHSLLFLKGMLVVRMKAPSAWVIVSLALVAQVLAE